MSETSEQETPLEPEIRMEQITKVLIESNWPLSEVEIVKMPTQGMGGTVGIVRAKEGKYTYKIAGAWKTSENLNRDLGAYDFLNESGYKHISKLLKTKDDEKLISLNGKLLYLIEYIEGGRPPETPEVWSKIGDVTAELHLVKDFPFESDLRPVAVLPDLTQKAEEYPFKDEYLAVLGIIPDFEKYVKTLIHTEITTGNVVQKPDGSIVAIDWDEVGIGPAVLDIGILLLNNFVSEDLEIRKENAKAYYDAYFAKRPITEAEKEGVYYAALFWMCMYIPYGDINKRWNRIKWAVENKKSVQDLYIQSLP